MLLAIFCISAFVAVTAMIAVAVWEMRDPMPVFGGLGIICLAIAIAMHVLDPVTLDGGIFVRSPVRAHVVAQNTRDIR
jgi:hypothetical protein